MSFFGSIGKFLGGAAKTVIGAVGSLAGFGAPPPVAQMAPFVMPAAQTVQGLPWKLPSTMSSGPIAPGGAPARGGGFFQQAGQFLQAQGIGLPGIAGAMAGRPGARMKRGRLTGNAIPAGFQERMSKNGVIYLAKSSRRRGISGRDLSAFRRVSTLLSHVRQPAAFRHRRRK